MLHITSPISPPSSHLRPCISDCTRPLAVSALKGAPPDGATNLLTPMAMLSLYPYIIPKLAYDPLTDVVPVGNCSTLDIAVAVGSDVPAEIDTRSKFVA